MLRLTRMTATRGNAVPSPAKRPSSSVAIPDETKRVLLDRMADGETMSAACRSIGLAYGIVARWRRADPEFAKAYREARESLADRFAEESVDILDGIKLDTIEPKLAMATVALAREKAKSRQWMASKVGHETYGEKLQTTGEVRHAVVVLPPLVPLQRPEASARITETETPALPAGATVGGEGN